MQRVLQNIRIAWIGRSSQKKLWRTCVCEFTTQNILLHICKNIFPKMQNFFALKGFGGGRGSTLKDGSEHLWEFIQLWGDRPSSNSVSEFLKLSYECNVNILWWGDPTGFSIMHGWMDTTEEVFDHQPLLQCEAQCKCLQWASFAYPLYAFSFVLQQHSNIVQYVFNCLSPHCITWHFNALMRIRLNWKYLARI